MADGARQIFLAATGQNRGKTTTSLGLFAAFADRGLNTAFMKPVGQRWIMLDGAPADEDAALMRGVFNLPDSTQLLSPVQIPRGGISQVYHYKKKYGTNPFIFYKVYTGHMDEDTICL